MVIASLNTTQTSGISQMTLQIDKRTDVVSFKVCGDEVGGRRGTREGAERTPQTRGVGAPQLIRTELSGWT